MTKGSEMHGCVPDRYPDNDYFEHRVVSWNTVSSDGWDAREGVIQAGFNETFSTLDTGERIWLDRPSGKQELTINILDSDGNIASTHILRSGQAIVHVTGGTQINVVTPEGQGPISYFCDYPGFRPDEIRHS